MSKIKIKKSLKNNEKITKNDKKWQKITKNNKNIIFFLNKLKKIQITML